MVFTPRSRRAAGGSAIKGLASPKLRMARQKQSLLENSAGADTGLFVRFATLV
jgi:hypothetical protein